MSDFKKPPTVLTADEQAALAAVPKLALAAGTGMRQMTFRIYAKETPYWVVEIEARGERGAMAKAKRMFKRNGWQFTVVRAEVVS